MSALGIGVDQVINAVRAANQDVPAGRITRGQSDSIVRVEGKIKDPAQFARIVVAQQGGAHVYLSQVADVIDGEKEQDSISRINGRSSITLDIQKSQDANIVDTGRGINEAVAALKKRIPADVELRIVNSTADSVEKSVNRVKSTIVEGAVADRPDRLPVPAQLAQHGHHRAHAADRGDRDVHRAERVSDSR